MKNKVVVVRQRHIVKYKMTIMKNKVAIVKYEVMLRYVNITRNKVSTTKQQKLHLFIYFLTLRQKLASIHILISGEPKYNAVWAIFSLILCILDQQTLWHIMICFVFVYLCVIVSTVAAATAGRLPLCLSVSYNCCSLIG